MPVAVSEFPAGTPNRLGMQYGCYILFSLATVAILLRFVEYPVPTLSVTTLLMQNQNLCSYVQIWPERNRLR